MKKTIQKPKKLEIKKMTVKQLSEVQGGRVPVTIGWYTCIC